MEGYQYEQTVIYTYVIVFPLLTYLDLIGIDFKAAGLT